MVYEEQLGKAKLGILALVAELGDVTRACKLLGMSRSQFYAMKRAYETSGKEGLTPKIRRKPEMPNRTPAPLENQILSKTLEYQTISYFSLAAKLKSEGISVTPSRIRYVWHRHGLSTRRARIRWARSQNHTASVTTRDSQVEVVSIPSIPSAK